MKVKELIEKLMQMNPEQTVEIAYTNDCADYGRTEQEVTIVDVKGQVYEHGDGSLAHYVLITTEEE